MDKTFREKLRSMTPDQLDRFIDAVFGDIRAARTTTEITSIGGA